MDKKILLYIVIFIISLNLLLSVNVNAFEFSFNGNTMINNNNSFEDDAPITLDSNVPRLENIPLFFKLIISLLCGVCTSLIISIIIVCLQRDKPVYISNLVETENRNYTIETTETLIAQEENAVIKKTYNIGNTPIEISTSFASIFGNITKVYDDENDDDENFDEYDNNCPYVDNIDNSHYKRPHDLTNGPERHYGNSNNSSGRHYDPF